VNHSCRSALPEYRFSVGAPETAISHERLKEVSIRGVDGSIHAVNDNGQWKWFCTNLVKVTHTTGPRDNPFYRQRRR